MTTPSSQQTNPQQATHNFMVTLSRRIRDIATVELFEGLPSRAVNKLALDFIVPATWEVTDGYWVQVVAYLSYTNDKGNFARRPILARCKYDLEHVRSGPNMWDSWVEVLAYPLVTGLKKQIEQLVKPKFLLLIEGDMRAALHNTKRIWV